MLGKSVFCVLSHNSSIFFACFVNYVLCPWSLLWSLLDRTLELWMESAAVFPSRSGTWILGISNALTIFAALFSINSLSLRISLIYFESIPHTILLRIKLSSRLPNSHVLALFLCLLENCQMNAPFVVQVWRRYLCYVIFFFGAKYWSNFSIRDCILFTSSWGNVNVL